MMEYYLYIKSTHLIFVVTWFAALFYLPRILIYQIESQEKNANEKEIIQKQLRLMAHRLWNIIGWPSAILATVFGIHLLVVNPGLLQQGWMHIKLTFVLLLWIYHLYTHHYYRQLQIGDSKKTATFMRLWNEVATLILFAVVFLAFLKNSFNGIIGALGLLGLMILIFIGFKVYLKRRKK